MKQAIPANDQHLRPEGVDDLTVQGVGKMTEALEKIERARGKLYDLHQLIGGADAQVNEAAEMLAEAGHPEQAELLRQQIVGLNVLAGRWTFQIVEEFDTGYYATVKAAEERVRNDLVSGRKHIYESEMKERNRSGHQPGYEARP